MATGTWTDGKISENLTKFLIERGILTDAVATGPSHNPDGTVISHPLVLCPIVHGWPKAPPSKRDFHRIYPSLEEMTWTRVALDIIGIPRSSHHRDSDYDVTFRLLIVLVEGSNSCQYDPRRNDARLHYARDALWLLGIYSGGSVHSAIRSYVNTPLTYLPTHTLREITQSWETRLSPTTMQHIRAEAPYASTRVPRPVF
jgi:hypothetical protein